MARCISPLLLCWPGCCSFLANLTAVRLHYIISYFPICRWADLFLQAPGGFWNSRCICFLLEWSWILWQKPRGSQRWSPPALPSVNAPEGLLSPPQVVISESTSRAFSSLQPCCFSLKPLLGNSWCFAGWVRFAPETFPFIVRWSQKDGWDWERVSKTTRTFIPALL